MTTCTCVIPGQTVVLVIMMHTLHYKSMSTVVREWACWCSESMV